MRGKILSPDTGAIDVAMCLERQNIDVIKKFTAVGKFIAGCFYDS